MTSHIKNENSDYCVFVHSVCPRSKQSAKQRKKQPFSFYPVLMDQCKSLLEEQSGEENK